MVYKWCVVPQCTNTSISSPQKLFLSVPTNPKRRKKWLQLARRDPNSIVAHSNVFMCEDHFDMEKDTANYMKYKMGFSQKILLAGEAVPSKFHCQEDRKRRLHDACTSREVFVKRQRKDLVKECEEESHLLSQNITETLQNHDNNLLQKIIDIEPEDMDGQQRVEAPSPSAIAGGMNVAAGIVVQADGLNIKEERGGIGLDIGPTVLQHVDSFNRTNQPHSLVKVERLAEQESTINNMNINPILGGEVKMEIIEDEQGDMDGQQRVEAPSPSAIAGSMNVAAGIVVQADGLNIKEERGGIGLDIGPTVLQHVDSFNRTNQPHSLVKVERLAEQESTINNMNINPILGGEVKMEIIEDEQGDMDGQQRVEAPSPSAIAGSMNVAAGTVVQDDGLNIKEERGGMGLEIGPTVLQHMDSYYRTNQPVMSIVKHESTINNNNIDPIRCVGVKKEFIEDERRDMDGQQRVEVAGSMNVAAGTVVKHEGLNIKEELGDTDFDIVLPVLRRHMDSHYGNNQPYSLVKLERLAEQESAINNMYIYPILCGGLKMEIIEDNRRGSLKRQNVGMSDPGMCRVLTSLQLKMHKDRLESICRVKLRKLDNSSHVKSPEAKDTDMQRFLQAKSTPAKKRKKKDVKITATNKTKTKKDVKITATNKKKTKKDVKITATNKRKQKKQVKITDKKKQKKDVKITATNKKKQKKDAKITATNKKKQKKDVKTAATNKKKQKKDVKTAATPAINGSMHADASSAVQEATKQFSSLGPSTSAAADYSAEKLFFDSDDSDDLEYLEWNTDSAWDESEEEERHNEAMMEAAWAEEAQQSASPQAQQSASPPPVTSAAADISAYEKLFMDSDDSDLSTSSWEVEMEEEEYYVEERHNSTRGTRMMRRSGRKKNRHLSTTSESLSELETDFDSADDEVRAVPAPSTSAAEHSSSGDKSSGNALASFSDFYDNVTAGCAPVSPRPGTASSPTYYVLIVEDSEAGGGLGDVGGLDAGEEEGTDGERVVYLPTVEEENCLHEPPAK